LAGGRAAALGGAGAVAPLAVALAVPVRNIATFHLNGLGDLLFTLPALHALREAFPGARICAVVRPALAPLLQHSPFVDEVLLRPKGGLSQQTALVKQLRARHLDLCVAFSQSRNTSVLVWSTGAPTRIGFESSRMESLLTDRVPKTGPPRIETHLDLVRALGCRPLHCDYAGLLHPGPQAVLDADSLLARHGVEGAFVVAACEASERRGIKEWPPAHWARALDELAAQLPVVLVGTAPAHELTSLMTRPAIDLGGCTDLPVLAALCARARLFVGIDSGVMHLAAAMNTPVAAVFGPTDWRLTGPRGVAHRIVRHEVECSPCLLSTCKWKGEDERKCLTRLPSEALVAGAREIIGL
jgi:ADP-heptose:LPS heptosyltransferase